LPLQQSQSSQQDFLSSVAEMVVAFASPSFRFIGHESPVHLPSLQQSQSSQHEVVALPEVSFFFIGQESLLQQDRSF
jgi:hypothetical protein